MKIRTYKEYDVIVAGGGPAGCAASAAFAGAAFEIAPVRQPASLCFILTHVDFTNFVPEKMNGAHPESPIHKILALGDKYPLIRDTHFCIDVLYEGTVSFNVGHLPKVDDTDPGAADSAMIVGRAMAAETGTDVGCIDIAELQSRLRRNGAVLV